jgi:NADH-quinone oxidoreductase subunit M
MTLLTHSLSTQSSFPFVAILLGIPLLSALVVALLPAEHKALIRWVAILSSLATLGVAIAMGFAFDAHQGGYQFVTEHTYASALGISWLTGVDGISLFIIGLTALVVPLVLLGAGEQRRSKAFIAWVLLLEGACIGSFVSLDLILFFLFFELTLVPSYFLITGWGGRNRSAAATKFFVYTFVGSGFLLVGILYVAFAHAAQTHHLTFSLLALQNTSYSGVVGVLLFCAFTFAFLIKAPIFPFHTWSPDTYGEAPTGAAMLLSAILAKLGTYGIIRFDLGLFPHASKVAAPVLLTLATISILYGALVACAQKDLKRLVAYSSLAQMGFIALGTFAFTTQALTGAVLLMLNHGIITAAFFLIIGMIAKRRGTWQTDDLKGLQGPAPVLAAAFTIVMLASIGLPGLNGFVSEYLVLIGTFLVHAWWAAIATLGVVVAAIYLLWAYQRSFHGKAEGANAAISDLSLPERLVLAPLLALIFALGIFPGPVLHRIEPSVNRILDEVTVANCPPHLLCASSPAGAAGTIQGGSK